jgi:hypothetical protein
MPTVRCSSLRLGVALLIGAIASAAAADDQRIIRLEQDVRKLERVVQEQARQIEALRRAGRDITPRAPSEPSAASESSLQWLSAARWDRVRAGMSELEAIEILGPPTQLRPGDGGSRVLLYAMEIGASGFLAGNVTVQEGKVVGVERPALK